MEITNKMDTIILHHGKAAKTMSFEGEILDYVLYNRAFGNTVTSNEVILKLWSMDETFRENIGVYFKNNDIFFGKEIFLLSEKYSHF